MTDVDGGEITQQNLTYQPPRSFYSINPRPRCLFSAPSLGIPLRILTSPVSTGLEEADAGNPTLIRQHAMYDVKKPISGLSRGLKGSISHGAQVFWFRLTCALPCLADNKSYWLTCCVAAARAFRGVGSILGFRIWPCITGCFGFFPWLGFSLPSGFRLHVPIVLGLGRCHGAALGHFLLLHHLNMPTPPPSRPLFFRRDRCFGKWELHGG